MKPHIERLPLIDKAIEFLNGKWPDHKGIQGVDRKGVFFLGISKPLHLQMSYGLRTNAVECVCNQQEFEQRKVELTKEQEVNSDWHENCEFPPVGTECEFASTWGWDRVVIVAHHEGICEYYNKRLDEYIKTGYTSFFRPIPTEKDVLVDQMERSLESTSYVSTSDYRALAEHLIDQGYRKTKSMSEDEFAHAASDVHHGSYRELYRAGCRFVEVGNG